MNNVLFSESGLSGNDLIAPLVFRLVESAVRCGRQLRYGHVAIAGQDGNAATNARISCCGRMPMRNFQVRHRVSCCFTNPGGAVQPGIRKNHGEFLATVARSHVGRTAVAGSQCACDLLQALIAS